MSNVLINSLQVNRIPRNGRYAGGYGVSISNVNNTTNNGANAIDPFILEFNTDQPQISDYSIYADIYGQTPTIELFTIDENNNRIKRPEQPYFNMILNDANEYIINSIVFGTLSDGIQTGFITIKK